MYCEFCNGTGSRTYEPEGFDCTHCDGTGYEPNNYFGSLDPEWCEWKKRGDPNWDECWGTTDE